MYAFEYHRPTSLGEAADLARKFEDGKIVAGGMTLIPTLKQRLAMPTDMVDLGKLEDVLMAEGVEKFSQPHKDLLALIEKRCGELQKA